MANGSLTLANSSSSSLSSPSLFPSFYSHSFLLCSCIIFCHGSFYIIHNLYVVTIVFFCGCCGNCFMSSLFCVVIMSPVLGPFLQFLIHVVVQRLCSRFWGCCYNVFHDCCGSHSSSLLCVVLLHCQ